MRFSIYLFLLLLSGLPALSAQQPMSMEDCVQYALTRSTEVRAAELKIKDAEWQIQENKATGMPQFSASLDLQRFIQAPALPAEALGFAAPPGTKIQFSLNNQFTGTLQATQLVFSNTYLTALRAARFYREYVEVQAQAKRREIRNRVMDAYLPALLLSENVAVLDKNITNLDKMLAETKGIQQAGFAEQLDVDRLELSVSSLKTERENLLRQREMVVNALKFTMNQPVGEPLILKDDLAALLGAVAEPDLNAPIDFSTRTDYQYLMKGKALSALNVELYEKTWLPTVAAFGAWNGSVQGNDKLFWIPSSLVGLKISVPIYDFGGTKAKRERALIGVQEVDLQREMLENAINLEYETAKIQFRSAKARVESQQKNLALAQRIFDTTQTKYKAGVGSSFEMISAEQGLYSAQQALMSAQYELLSAKTAIQKSLN